MIHFARIINVLNHQLLWEQMYVPVKCDCGKPDCTGRKDRPVIRIATWTKFHEKEAMLFMLASAPSAEHARAIIDTASFTECKEVLTVMQQAAYGTITPEEAKAQYDAIINDLGARALV